MLNKFSIALDVKAKNSIKILSKELNKSQAEIIRELIEKGLKETESDKKIEKFSDEIGEQIFNIPESISSEIEKTDGKILKNSSDIRENNKSIKELGNQIRILTNKFDVLKNQIESENVDQVIKSENSKMIFQFIDHFAGEKILSKINFMSNETKINYNDQIEKFFSLMNEIDKYNTSLVSFLENNLNIKSDVDYIKDKVTKSNNILRELVNIILLKGSDIYKQFFIELKRKRDKNKE